HDQATPSGNGAAALALSRLAALTGDTRYADAAERTLRLFLPGVRAQPAGYATLLMALEEWLEPPATAIVRGAPEALRAWTGAMAREYLPRTLVLAIPAGLGGLPPLLDKPGSSGVQAWLCRGAVCLPPLDSIDALRMACSA
ncbi:MAG: thioredoxin domain-containing protein, partial [Betaproteobacteria bacterium]|nr:thioredoxin domain-containing protein [Betaproteobacteria bacterium]